jgi:ATP-dependent Clp protease ATP-binding subunit ClpB
MDFNRLTIKSQEAVGAAMEMARKRGNPEVYPEHLCLALLDQELPRTLVERAGGSVDAQRQECEARLSAKPSVQGSSQQPHASTAFAQVLDRAEETMRKLDDEFVSVEHLLLALDIVPRDALLEALQQVRGSQRVTSQDPEGS